MFKFDETEADKLAQRYGTPLYVYRENVIRESCRNLKNAFSDIKTRIYYAVKANSNPWILNILKEEGVWADVVSPGEIYLALHAGFPAEKLLFTQNSVSDEQMKYALDSKVRINVESLSQLKRLGLLAPGTDISIRFNIYIGAGHHSHVITGGPMSKFGIDWESTDQVKEIAAEGNLKVKGIHCHIGSGILDAEMFVRAVKNLLITAKKIPDLEVIDFGGGIGIPYRPGEKPLVLKELGRKLSDEYMSFCKDYGKKPELAVEPGRYLVAESGSLLIRVTSIKESRKYTFIGTDTGFNHLIRPAFYGSYHRIEPAVIREGGKTAAVITGNLCESGDVFTRTEDGIEPRKFTPIEEGDLLIIRNTGAYGFSMASHYNSFPLPAEILVKGNESRLIRKRETYDQLLNNIPDF